MVIERRQRGGLREEERRKGDGVGKRVSRGVRDILVSLLA